MLLSERSEVGLVLLAENGRFAKHLSLGQGLFLPTRRTNDFAISVQRATPARPSVH
jgi:hypothetical protein